MDPEIVDAGPTKEHKGTGVFAHIESKLPKPMVSAAILARATTNSRISSCGGGVDGWSPQRRGYGGEDGISVPTAAWPFLHPSCTVSLDW